MRVLLVLCLAFSFPQKGNRIPYSDSTQKKSVASEQSFGTSYFVEQPTIETAEQQYDPYSDRLYRAYLRATIIAAFFSFAVIVMLVWQNIITQRVANAAKASADALKTIERAWLIIWYENLVHVDYRIPGHDVYPPPTGTKETATPQLVPAAEQQDLTHVVNWHAQNIGKTPAFITEVWTRFIEIKNLDELPADPDYSRIDAIKYSGDPLKPGDRSYWIVADLEFNPRFGGTTFDDIEARHRSRKTVLFAYGYVRYEDAFGESRETRFGIAYAGQPSLNFHLDGWRVAGPKAYNKH